MHLIKLRRVAAVMCSALLFLCLPIQPANACEGTPKRLCSRTVWFTILAQRNAVLPQNGPVNIPIFLLPYVYWDIHPACGQPMLAPGNSGVARLASNMQVTLEVTLVSVENGSLIDLGITMADLPVPTEPGLQPSPYTIQVPEGMVNRDETYVVNVHGTITVEFGGSVFGNGSVSASTTAQNYLIPASDADESVARVNIRYLSSSEDVPYMRCRRGDQTYLYFLVENNTLDKSVNLDLSTTIGQVAVLPDGYSGMTPTEIFNDYVHGISTAGDNFNHALFIGGEADWGMLPEGDPHVNPVNLTGNISLLAGRSQVVAVCVRTLGMCANGSCNKVTLAASGVFSDNTLAKACASTAVVVADMASKSLRCEYEDQIKTGANSATCFSEANYYNAEWSAIPHATTNKFGNKSPTEPTGGWWLYGVDLGMSLAVDQVTDIIRFDETRLPSGVSFSYINTGSSGFGHATVEFMGLPQEVGSSYSIPVVQHASELLIKIDAVADTVFIATIDGSVVFYQGSWSEFVQGPQPSGFSLDEGSCRIFTKTEGLTGFEICTDRFGYSKLYRPPHTGVYTVEVYNGEPLSGDVTLLQIPETVVQVPSTYNGSFEIRLNVNAVSPAPLKHFGWLIINAPGAKAPRPVPLVVSLLPRVEFTVHNEADLLSAWAAARARDGHMDVFFGSTPIAVGTASELDGGPSGDFITVEGDLAQSEGHSAGVPVIIDASGCPAPCAILSITGNNNLVRDIILDSFPATALSINGDLNIVERCVVQNSAGTGISVDGNSNLIGSPSGATNTLTANGGNGITIVGGTGNHLLGNTFIGNAGLPIDLGGDGITDNDVGDADEGANNLQNYPQIDMSAIVSGDLMVSGTLNSVPEMTFTLQFYRSDQCDVTGQGIHAVYLESQEVTTDASGDTDFSFTADENFSVGDYFLALATDPDGNTSEFSVCADSITSEISYPENDIFVLYAPEPNPFSGKTTLGFELHTASGVQLMVGDLLGRQVHVVYVGHLPAGTHRIPFQADGLQPGIYVCKLEVGAFTGVQKMMILD